MIAAVTGTAALATAFGAGVLVATGDAGVSSPPGVRTPPVQLVNADLTAPDSCEDLLDSYVQRAIDRVGPWGWGGGGVVYAAEGERAAASDSLGAAPTTTRATNGDTGTNVQEAGVDEPDVVKTDGEHVFRINDDELTTYDATGEEVVELASLDLDGIADAEMLLVGDRLVVTGANLPRRDGDTRMVVVDVSDPAAPTVSGTWVYDAALVTMRLNDDVVRLVLSTGLPELDFVTPEEDRGEPSARRENEAVVRDSTLDDWLPNVVAVTDDDTVDPATGELVADCSEVAVPADDEAALGTMTVVALDPGGTTDRTVSAVATDAQTTYFSADRMYLATSAGWGWCCVESLTSPFSDSTVPQVDGTTQLFAFSLDGATTEYVASGEVDGEIRDRWAMDSADGVLRLALGATSATGSFNSVVTLREDDDELVEVGRLDGLGPHEDIRSVRWFDDLAILVTFRQVDPLYAVDLSDVEEPESLGMLKIPGYSEYLHPLGADRMIGVGQDATLAGTTTGAQAALFDVTDLTDPRRLDTVEYPRMSQAGAATDPRQFTWLPEQRIALTVVSKGWEGRTGWVSVLRLGDGRMEGELLPVEYGDEIAEVRMVPLPSGRVVLVTGDGLSFLDL
ncbi:beta-propeller domain-containing protein [Nocardioides sp. LHG3406-4]|uniref:beta-propeller domain-containing protein n=1 Tax=Nocardioides sp. LHG3406-4 TaxID=2804575 RepID=UPI003CE7A8C5